MIAFYATFRVAIKYSHSHLSSHPSSHLKMPTKIEINKILTPSNFDFYIKLTPDVMNKVPQFNVEWRWILINLFAFIGQNHTHLNIHFIKALQKKIDCESFNLVRAFGLKFKLLSGIFPKKWMMKDLLMKLEKCLWKSIFQNKM